MDIKEGSNIPLESRIKGAMIAYDVAEWESQLPGSDLYKFSKMSLCLETILKKVSPAEKFLEQQIGKLLQQTTKLEQSQQCTYRHLERLRQTFLEQLQKIVQNNQKRQQSSQQQISQQKGLKTSQQRRQQIRQQISQQKASQQTEGQQKKKQQKIYQPIRPRKCQAFNELLNTIISQYEGNIVITRIAWQSRETLMRKLEIIVRDVKEEGKEIEFTIQDNFLDKLTSDNLLDQISSRVRDSDEIRSISFFSAASLRNVGLFLLNHNHAGENAEKIVAELPLYYGIAGDVEVYLYKATAGSANVVVKRKKRKIRQLLNTHLQQHPDDSVTIVAPLESCRSVVNSY